MNKEEILEKSRKENKNQDIYEQEIIAKARGIGAAVAAVLATVFFITQILTGHGMNYGLYAIIFSILATTFIVKAIYLKRKHEVAMAVGYTLATLLFVIAHMYNLFTSTFIM